MSDPLGIHTRQRKTARGTAIVVAVTSMSLLSGGVALAAIPDSGTGVYSACYSKNNGAVRLIDAQKGDKCDPKSEMLVT